MNAYKMSISERRALLDSSLKRGRIASIAWKKASGEATKRNFTEKCLDGFRDGIENAKPNPVKDKPELYTAWDLSKRDWSNVNLNNLISVALDGETWEFGAEDV